MPLLRKKFSSAAGWYALPDPSIEFPYGLELSPAESINPQAYFSKTAYIIVGENDNDPNASSLRNNQQADRQGLHRLERAQYFFDESFSIALNGSYDCKWQFRIVPNVGHDGEAMVRYAADLLY